jgi:hypothetical protein
MLNNNTIIVLIVVFVLIVVLSMCYSKKPIEGMRTSGKKGPRGQIGKTGKVGPAGIQGDVGPAGIQGDVGPAGIQGKVGPAGIQGKVGPSGATADYNNVYDLQLGGFSKDRGDTGQSRALVKDNGALVLNYQNDYRGGLFVDSEMTVRNNVVVNGILTASNKVQAPLLCVDHSFCLCKSKDNMNLAICGSDGVQSRELK